MSHVSDRLNVSLSQCLRKSPVSGLWSPPPPLSRAPRTGRRCRCGNRRADMGMLPMWECCQWPMLPITNGARACERAPPIPAAKMAAFPVRRSCGSATQPFPPPGRRAPCGRAALLRGRRLERCQWANGAYISLALIFLRMLRLKSRGPPKKRISEWVIGNPSVRRCSIKLVVQTKSAT